MKNRNLSQAIVLGLYGSNAQGTITCLQKENIPVIGFHKDAKLVSPAANKINHYLAYDDESFINSLIYFGSNQDNKGIVFPTGDEELVLCDRNRERLEEFFILPEAKNKSLEKQLDKNEILKLGCSAGFNIPKSSYLSAEIDFEGPYIIKPLNSFSGFSKEDISLPKTFKELSSIRKELLEKYGEMSVQEYIPSDVEDNIEIHGFLADQKNPMIALMLQKVAAVENSTKGSIGTIAKSIWIPELKNLAENLFLESRFNGAMDINLIRHSISGKYYFLEVNYRTSANVSLSTKAGRNLPALVYYNLVDEPINNLISDEYREEIYWIANHRLDKKELIMWENTLSHKDIVYAM